VGGLVDRLVDELKSNREGGQPIIEEDQFPNGRLRVIVIWDEWDPVLLEDRTSTIIRAYELAEGREFRDRIALASGLTVPEAHAAGMLPYAILPAVRKGDPVTKEQCYQAMLEEGASVLFVDHKPHLLVPTEEEAEAARRRLAERLPNSESVWLIARDVETEEECAHR
jgi:hypothetical protein